MQSVYHSHEVIVSKFSKKRYNGLGIVSRCEETIKARVSNIEKPQSELDVNVSNRKNLNPLPQKPPKYMASSLALALDPP